MTAVLLPQGRGIKIPDNLREQGFQPYNKKFGLVIGIDSYKNNIPQLQFAVADARAIKQMLEADLGFDEVVILENQQATRAGIFRALSVFGQKMKQDDQAFFYFAGHGITFGANENEVGFLLPIDVTGTDESSVSESAISMTDIRDRLVRLQAKHVLLAVDACYGGYAASGVRSLSTETQNYIRVITTSKARQIIAAGRKDQQANENSEWGHSAFTYKILDGLKRRLADANEDGVVTAKELASYLESSVSRLTGAKQTPQYAKLTSDDGEFIFILGEGRTTSSASAPVSTLRRKGDVFIKSNPDGASVMVDGVPSGKTTPAEITGLEEGDHIVELRKGLFIAKDTISINANKVSRFEIVLRLGVGMLKISSTPFEADIFIEGKNRGKTPQIVENLPAGPVTVELKKQGYLRYTARVEITPEEQTTHAARLLLPASIRCASDPPGATVMINDSVAGTTPIKLNNLYPGSLTVRLLSPDYERWEQVVALNEGAETVLNPKLVSKYGYISVISVPEGSQVQIDGTDAGVTPLTRFKLTTGSHKIVVKKTDFTEDRQSVSIAPTAITSVRSILTQTVGYLTLRGIENNSSLLIDDKEVSLASTANMKLHLGEHSIKIVDNESGRADTKSISVNPGSKTTLQASYGVYNGNAVINSIVVPGLAQMNDGASGKGTVYLLGVVGTVVFSFISNSDYLTKNGDYETAKKNYSGAQNETDAARFRTTMQQKYDAANSAAQQRTIAVSALAAIYAWNVLDAVMFHSRQTKLTIVNENSMISLMPTVNISNGNVQVGLSLVW